MSSASQCATRAARSRHHRDARRATLGAHAIAVAHRGAQLLDIAGRRLRRIEDRRLAPRLAALRRVTRALDRSSRSSGRRARRARRARRGTPSPRACACCDGAYASTAKRATASHSSSGECDSRNACATAGNRVEVALDERLVQLARHWSSSWSVVAVVVVVGRRRSRSSSRRFVSAPPSDTGAAVLDVHGLGHGVGAGRRGLRLRGSDRLRWRRRPRLSRAPCTRRARARSETTTTNRMVELFTKTSL